MNSHITSDRDNSVCLYVFTVFPVKLEVVKAVIDESSNSPACDDDSTKLSNSDS